MYVGHCVPPVYHLSVLRYQKSRSIWSEIMQTSATPYLYNSDKKLIWDYGLFVFVFLPLPNSSLIGR